MGREGRRREGEREGGTWGRDEGVGGEGKNVIFPVLYLKMGKSKWSYLV